LPKLRSIGPRIRELQSAINDRIERTQWGDLVRPERLPKPNCTTWLICGPVAAGKTSFVEAHRGPDDIVIDLDAIAKTEFAMTRDRATEAVGMLLVRRNELLASLADQPREATAWFITSGAGAEQRRWWCRILGIPPDRLVLLNPGRDELYRRIDADPDRRSVRSLHRMLVDKWLRQEHG
jgi:hypothetical protein